MLIQIHLMDNPALDHETGEDDADRLIEWAETHETKPAHEPQEDAVDEEA